MGRIVEGLLTLARSDAGAIQLRRESGNLASLTREVVERASGEARERGVGLEVVAPVAVPGVFDTGLILQLTWNLVRNALRFAGPGGRVRISVLPEGELGILTVEDSGPGIPPGSEERVFERFWRGDPSRTHEEGAEGSGLGLAIVKVIADAHGGSVQASNDSQLGGARFQVVLPVLLEPPTRRTATKAPTPPPEAQGALSPA